MARGYKNLVAWQKGMTLAEGVYAVLKGFPETERNGLCDQMRRAAVSVPSNIAEGCGRETDRDWAHFLGQALGSLWELETQLELARRLGYVREAEAEVLSALSDEVGKMLGTMIRKYGGRR